MRPVPCAKANLLRSEELISVHTLGIPSAWALRLAVHRILWRSFAELKNPKVWLDYARSPSRMSLCSKRNRSYCSDVNIKEIRGDGLITMQRHKSFEAREVRSWRLLTLPKPSRVLDYQIHEVKGLCAIAIASKPYP